MRLRALEDYEQCFLFVGLARELLKQLSFEQTHNEELALPSSSASSSGSGLSSKIYMDSLISSVVLHLYAGWRVCSRVSNTHSTAQEEVPVVASVGTNPRVQDVGTALTALYESYQTVPQREGAINQESADSMPATIRPVALSSGIAGQDRVLEHWRLISPKQLGALCSQFEELLQHEVELNTEA